MRTSAYQNDDINEFEKILKTNRQTIMDDLFIREHIEGRKQAVYYTSKSFVITELLRNIRTQVLIKLIKPYTRIHLPFVSQVKILIGIYIACNMVFLGVKH